MGDSARFWLQHFSKESEQPHQCPFSNTANETPRPLRPSATMANQLRDPNPPHWDRQFIDGSLIPDAQDIPRPARNNLALGHNRSIRTLTTGTISSQDICGSLLASQIAPALSNAYIRNVLNILRLAEGLPVNVGNSAAQRIRQAAQAHGTPVPATRPKADEARMQPASTCLVRRRDGVAYHLAFYQNVLYLTILILPVNHEPLPVPANGGIQYIVAPAVPGPNFQVVLANPQGPQPQATPGQQITQMAINQPTPAVPTITTAPATVPSQQQSQAPSMPPTQPAPTATQHLSSAPNHSAPSSLQPRRALQPPVHATSRRARVRSIDSGVAGVKRSRETDAEDVEDWYLDTKRTCKDREREFYVYADPSAMVSVSAPFYSLTPHHVQAGWERCE